jgi:hypothetical protein
MAPNQQASIHFCMERGMHHELGTVLFLHKRIISLVKMVEFISDKMSHIIANLPFLIVYIDFFRQILLAEVR